MNTMTRPAPGPFAAGPIAAPAPAARDPHYDNQPPLEERILMDFEEDLQREGIEARIDELLASATRAPTDCSSEHVAGKLGDLCKQARAITVKLDAARERHNRQLIDARTSLKARADNIIAPLSSAVELIRKTLDDWTAREAARVREEQRKADEIARAAQEAARKAHEEQVEAERQRLAALAIPAEEAAEAIEAWVPPPPPTYAAPKIAAPIARGSYGSAVGTQEDWKFEIEALRQVPDRYLKHPKVKEALEQVIRAAIRTEKIREIKGVRIWSVTKAVVR